MIHSVYEVIRQIGVLTGPDGVFMVDAQFAPLSEKIAAAIKQISDRPIKFLVNTHVHGDHTGGNENFGKGGSLIVAHENVRKRMSVEQFIEAFNMRTQAAPPVALPVVTFTQSVTLHVNGDEIRAIHMPNAHTDGDAVVHFLKNDVLHMGDIYFNGMYPFIDDATGGSVEGVIAACDKVDAIVGDKTKVIPSATVMCFDGSTGKLLSSWGRNRFVLPHGLRVDAYSTAFRMQRLPVPTAAAARMIRSGFRMSYSAPHAFPSSPTTFSTGTS